MHGTHGVHGLHRQGEARLIPESHAGDGHGQRAGDQRRELLRFRLDARQAGSEAHAVLLARDLKAADGAQAADGRLVGRLSLEHLAELLRGLIRHAPSWSTGCRARPEDRRAPGTAAPPAPPRRSPRGASPSGRRPGPLSTAGPSRREQALEPSRTRESRPRAAVPSSRALASSRWGPSVVRRGSARPGAAGRARPPRPRAGSTSDARRLRYSLSFSGLPALRHRQGGADGSSPPQPRARSPRTPPRARRRPPRPSEPARAPDAPWPSASSALPRRSRKRA